jgi:mono/diheme cytochrome c family protein
MKLAHYVVVALFMIPAVGQAENASEAARNGYRLLLEKAYVPPYFDQETFDNVWKVWPPPLRSEAEHASADERRQMAFQRYGLSERPGEGSKKPLQFVVDANGNWTPNCFGCHGGKLLGESFPGRPNADYALQTLIQETRLTKLRLGKSLMPIDLGSLVVPLGHSVGTTNAVIFGVALAAHRDADLNIRPNNRVPQFVHHDMDAPPWWHYRKKDRIYLDGFAEKAHRPLMQFALDRANGPEKFREWEVEFRDIHEYLESLQPPEYPYSVDDNLADQGRKAFERVCAGCHGTYGKDETYPHRIVPISEIGTDRARFQALTNRHRRDYQENWFSHYGKDDVIVDPGGYMAPPLDGVWASAPFFHNGSVPTLWHVLHVDQRPTVWKRKSDDYDQDRVGFSTTAFDEMPDVDNAAERRHYFDTQRFGKSAAGHEFPSELSDEEKHAVLEYLKTL